MLLNKNISSLDLSELLKYLGELHELIMEERTAAFQAQNEIKESVARMVADSGGDIDTVIHALSNTQGMSAQAKLAGEASARLVKIAEIKSKVLIAMMKNEAESSTSILSEDDKQALLEEAARETDEGKTGTAS